MFGIWARTVKKDKIRKSFVYKGEGAFDGARLNFYLSEICDKMDVPTPVVLSSHLKNFEAFNITHFTPTDFVESVDFDRFVVEFCRESNSEKKHIYKEYLPTD